MKVFNPSTTVRGRVLIDEVTNCLGVLAGFHGYAQAAEDMLDQLRLIPGADRWTKVAVQALHPFYIRGDSAVVASWMTRQDRDIAIADNIAYVKAALASMHQHSIVFVGFSQGAAMAYRAARHSARPPAGIVALGGDIPPELKDDVSLPWPPVLIGVGDRETWYSPRKLEADLAFLQSRGIPHQVSRFDGGHEWTEAFRADAGRFIASVVPPA